MNIKITNKDLKASNFQCAIIGIYEDHSLSSSAKQLDKATSGHVKDILQRDIFSAKAGECLFLASLPKLKNESAIIVGCGKKNELTAKVFRQIITAVSKALKQYKISNAHCYLTELGVKDCDSHWQVRQLVGIIEHHRYEINAQRKATSKKKSSNTTLTLYSDDTKTSKQAKQAIREAQAIANGENLSRDLGNLPSNICTPSYMAKIAKQVAKKYPNVTCQVLSESEMRKLGMNVLLAVSQGAKEEAKLVVIKYNGASKSKAPYVLAGKGVTFDTGGISLKSNAGMQEMKYDMCGAATALGSIQAAAELELPLNVYAVLACSENMPGDNAVKPTDVITSMSGQTVEILNTDAEGRLVVSDALTYCERFKPELVIDLGTYTGACMVALGSYVSGLMTNDEELATELTNAGNYTWDRVWRLPLWEEYDKELDSEFADMKNIAGRWGGAIIAGCFLSRFAKNFRWAHLDMAGPSANSKGGATGRPVPLLTQFLINQVR